MKRSKPQHPRREPTSLLVELLETRQVLSTFGLSVIAVEPPLVNSTVNVRLVPMTYTPLAVANLAGSDHASTQVQASTPPLLPLVQDLGALSPGFVNSIAGPSAPAARLDGPVSPPNTPSQGVELNVNNALAGIDLQIHTESSVGIPPENLLSGNISVEISGSAATDGMGSTLPPSGIGTSNGTGTVISQPSVPPSLPVVQDLVNLATGALEGALDQIAGPTTSTAGSNGPTSPPSMPGHDSLSLVHDLVDLSTRVVDLLAGPSTPPAGSEGLADNLPSSRISVEISGPSITDGMGATVQSPGGGNSNGPGANNIEIPLQTGGTDSGSVSNHTSISNQGSASANTGNENVLAIENPPQVNTVLLNQSLIPPPAVQNGLLPVAGTIAVHPLDLFAVIGERDLDLSTNGSQAFSDDQEGEMAPELAMEQHSPESSGLMFEAAPFNIDSMENALQQFLDQLGNLREGMNNLVQGMGPSPWIFMSMALAITLHEMVRRRLQRMQEQKVLIGMKGVESLHWFSGVHGKNGDT